MNIPGGGTPWGLELDFCIYVSIGIGYNTIEILQDTNSYYLIPLWRQGVGGWAPGELGCESTFWLAI